MQECYHKSLLIPVWIRAACLPLLQCALTSASEDGAELKLEDPFVVPDRFDLFFSPIAQSWRECYVNWRKYEAKSIGINFVARHIFFGAISPHSNVQIYGFALMGSDVAPSDTVDDSSRHLRSRRINAIALSE
mgnify:CR=1 FL=1